MIPIKILVVEDEQLVADDLRETLEYLGYVVPALVATGEDAIVMVEALQPDLVLMDIRLGGEMDGVEASFKIQSCFHVPVVYLTANADGATLERVKATQPFGYILKPFDERILSTTIEIALKRHEAELEVQKALSIAQADKQIAQLQSYQKSQYLYIAAHEFRNPLTTIRLGSEILKHYSNQLPKEKIQKHIERIQSATNSLTHLLNDILTLGQAESGVIQCNPARMDVVTFCQEQIETLQLTTGEKHKMQFSVIGKQRIACLDEKLLWHLLNNLLSNAIKYSPEGGIVSLTVSLEQDLRMNNVTTVIATEGKQSQPAIFRSACVSPIEEKNIFFQVQDQGIGIPKESQAKLFEPFQRARNVGNIPGTGLGLAIVKQCVEMHRGTISFESEISQGTTFVVRLPLQN